MAHANLLTRVTRFLVPRPRVITTMHNQDEGHQWRYYAYRLTDPLAAVTTTVSQVAVEEAIRRHAVRRGNMLSVPNGSARRTTWMTQRSARRPEPRLDWVTRFHLAVSGASHGGQAPLGFLLAAVHIVKRTDPCVRLLIAGIGDCSSELQAQIDRAGLESNVSLMGLRSDVPAAHAGCRRVRVVVRVGGTADGSPRGWCRALPIVTTDVGGSRDVVKDQETGFLAPPRRPERLAEAMLRLMALDPSERLSLGARSRQQSWRPSIWTGSPTAGRSSIARVQGACGHSRASGRRGVRDRPRGYGRYVTPLDAMKEASEPEESGCLLPVTVTPLAPRMRRTGPATALAAVLFVMV